MHMYNQTTLRYTWNEQNIINQLSQRVRRDLATA